MPKDDWEVARRAQTRKDAAIEYARYGELHSYERISPQTEELATTPPGWQYGDWRTYLVARSHLREKKAQLAVELLEPLADKCYAVAQFWLGGIYDFELGDPSLAVSYYELAAGNGHAEAKCLLGRAYLNGESVEEDGDKAFALLCDCIDDLKLMGSTWLGGAHFALARCFLRGLGTSVDGQKAIAHLHAASDDGHFGAQYWLGHLFWTGMLFGAEAKQDSSKAASFFQKAAEKEIAEAKYKLGLLYLNGDGVEQDEGKAFSLLKSAVDGNFFEPLLPEAQNCLAVCYLHGRGTPIDESKALELLEAAVAKDCEVAQYNLARRYYFGDIVEQNYTKAFRLFEQAARWQDPDAVPSEFYLAACHEEGLGTEKDEAKAIEWLETGARRGCQLCRGRLRHLSGSDTES
jgi:hypothetical protein